MVTLETSLCLGKHKSNRKFPYKSELSQDSVARLTCALPLNLLKSMTHNDAHNSDFNVTQVGRNGTA